MQTTVIVIAVLLVVAIAAWWVMQRRAAASPDERREDRIDTLAGWPPEPTRILTTAERLAYSILVRALPGYMVLAQVPLSRFTRVPTRNSYVEWLRRVGNLCADLVVCDMATQVIAVIHVQSASSASSERVQRRYERMARVLKAEKIAFHTWIEGAFPSPEGARTALLREVPAVQAAPAQPTQPGDLDEPDRNAGVEERGDAPPSTWYSELDSSALPLDPRSPRGTTHR